MCERLTNVLISIDYNFFLYSADEHILRNRNKVDVDVDVKDGKTFSLEFLVLGIEAPHSTV